MAKISDLSDAELGAKMRRIFTERNEHCDAGRMGDDAERAHEIINGLTNANREARAVAAGGPDPRNIERSEDDAQPTVTLSTGQQNGGSLVNGSYDLAFTLYNTNSTGVPIAGPVTNRAIAVTNGLFTTTVDFGPGYFNATGTNNWLSISVSLEKDSVMIGTWLSNW